MAVIFQTSKARSRRGSVSPVPAAPVSVTATVTGGQVTVTWQDPSDSTALQYYRVLRSSGAAYTQVGTANPVTYPATQSYIDSVTEGGTYTYRVTCYSVQGAESAPATSNSVVVSGGVTDVFGWASYVSDPYSIGSYAAGVPSTYPLLPLAVVPSGSVAQFSAISATDPSIVVGSSSGVIDIPATLSPGNYSITVGLEDVAQLPPPAFTVYSPSSSSAIVLGWTSVAAATSYTVERSPNGVSDWVVVVSQSNTTYIDTGLSPNTTYWYRARAFESAAPGLYSTAVSATTPSAAGSGDFAARAADPNVVWSHDFTYPEEFTQFINGVDPYTTNYPPILIPRREAVTINGRSTFCLAFTFIGNRVAAPMPADLAHTTMVLEDATDFPDPLDPAYSCVPSASDKNYPTPGYYLWIQTDPANGKRQSNASGTSPATRERVYVTGKSGNTLTVRRAQYANELLAWPDASGVMPYVGNEPSGDWDRPLSGFAAGQNGKPVADNNAGRPITRTWTAGRHNTYFREGAGWYAHPDYDALPDPQNGNVGTWYGYPNWREGREYWVSWSMWVDPARFEGLNETVTSKLVWIGDIAGSTATHELVMSVDPTYSVYDVTPSGHITGRIFCYTGFGQQTLQDPFAGSGAKSLQPGGPWAGTCLTGSSNRATNLCLTLPLGEWVTFMAHVVTGHDETSYFDGGDTGLELFVAQGGQWVTVFRKLDMGIKYGWPGGSPQPPGFNTFHPTRYYNASLTQIPAKTFSTRFSEMILSHAPILPPA